MRRRSPSLRSCRPGRLGLSVVLLLSAAACSDLLTSAPDGGDLFDSPLEGLTDSEMLAFARGDREFGRRFAPISGLGPIFNDVSCASCHSGDGRGRRENALVRIGTPAEGMAVAIGGPQIQTKAIYGAEPEPIPSGIPLSLRLPPPVFGVGLIEAIPEATIVALADPDDADGDGISGRPNFVLPAGYVPGTEPGSGTTPRIGRFGRKAQVSSLLEQTVEAYHQDMGITSDFQPVENRNPLASQPHDAADEVTDPEIPAATVLAVVNYLRLLAPPAPGAMTPQREQGEALFHSIGCASCHVPTLQTGPSSIAVLADRPVTLYSDLLLHDMGDALADHRPDGGASGREWRTAPLWGLRVMQRFLNGEAFLLHDGRARSVEEAILLHGGEGQGARDAFAALGDAERRALLDYVSSR
ncbi:MAG TPA: di-heme oxidoredictase family protein [Gemmatimonadaceae bacterium]|nr:di-heme oxidoredictase family protein [Gemmatimonadaceae bacterium]